ncbi:MAG: DUF2948 family protein [Paracoccaceae bacterium]
MSDARFADGADEAPLRLLAREPADLAVISALAQDAVLTAGQMVHAPRRRRVALGLNRFRWEDADRAQAQGRGFERVQSLLVIENVLSVQSAGIEREGGSQSLELLALSFAAEDAPAGWLRLHLSGGADLRMKVEALDVRLRDVSRPYLAPSGKRPDHGAA